MLDINTMSIEDIETRMSEIENEIVEADADTLDVLESEIEALNTRRAEIIETRRADISAVINGNGNVVEDYIEERENNAMEIRNSKEYIDAFAKYIKTGDATECRALLTENATNGTVPVPEFVHDVVGTAWERSEIMSLIRRTSMKGNVKVAFEISATGAVIHEEGGDAVDEEALVLGIATLVPASIKKWVGISDEALDMDSGDFLRYIYDELTYRIVKAAEDALIAGIISAPATNQSGDDVPAVPVVEADAIALGTIAEALGKLSDEAANPVVVMNKATWAAFKAAQYTGNFAMDIFEGMNVVFNNSLDAFADAAAGETYAIVGDFGRGALANFPNGDGVDIKFDDMTLMTSDIVRILGRQYVGIGIVAPNAFVKIAKSESSGS